MEIRKFIFSIVSKFDPKGFKQADKAAKASGAVAAKAAKQWATLAKAQDKAADARKAGAATGISALDAQLASIKAEIAATNASIAAAERKAERTKAKLDGMKDDRLSSFKEGFSGLGGVFGAVASGLLAVGAASVVVATGVLTTGASFESLRAQLNQLLGSESAGTAAFAKIKTFATQTPFQLEEVTGAYIKLQNFGIKPTEERLTALGDIAAAGGKNLDDITEAALDASQGEGERLREFGIQMKKNGDKVSLSFKGVTTEVDNNSEAITDALVTLGQLEGVSGAMAAQMDTTKGVVSNLTDSVSQFLDTIAQMGVLDEFKGLLTDLSKVGGKGNGFAGIVADALVTALKALRQILSEITEEDIREFLQGAVSLANAFATALGIVSAAMGVFVEMSGDVDSAMANMAIAVFALTAAFTGPAGLAVAAGAVGVILGRMLANLALNLDGTNDQIDRLDTRIANLRSTIAATTERIEAIEAAGASEREAIEQTTAALKKKSEASVQAEIGGLGAGLATGVDATGSEAIFLAGNLARGADGREMALSKLATAEGRKVLASVDAAQAKKASKVEATARREARRAGASKAEQDAAGARARAASTTAGGAERQKALTEASTVFTATGSAELAAKAGKQSISGKKKGGGKKDKLFFDFEKQVDAAALSQSEKFAGEELARLRGEGVEVNEAIAQSRAAGQAREKDLKAKFLEAGRVFDASATGILDILGLKGPGSVLANRPPPQTLIITIAPKFVVFETFNQTIGAVTGAKQLEEVSGEAGRVAVEQGMEPSTERWNAMFAASVSLQADRLLKAEGGGTLPTGAQG